MDEKIKILYLSSSPNDQQKLSVDKEFRAIYQKVDRIFFEMISVSEMQASELTTKVLENNPEIFHFSGHAFSDEILFENAEKQSQGVPKTALVNFFRELEKKPRLVFFNSCRTAENLESLREIIDFVVTTRRAVFDEVAVEFAAKFYEFLSRGVSVKTAFNLAKSQFHIESSKVKAEMYELFSKDGVDETLGFISSLNETDEERGNAGKYKIEGDANNINIFDKNNIGNLTFNNKK